MVLFVWKCVSPDLYEADKHLYSNQVSEYDDAMLKSDGEQYL